MYQGMSRISFLTTRLGALALGLAAAATPVWAGGDGADGSYSPDDIAQIDVLPGWRTQDGTHIAALRIRLADGWKTYWRAPGDAGIPPGFTWAGSRNLQDVQFIWPTPQVFEQNGMRTVGYSHELILPMVMTPAMADKPIRLKARLALGVCRDVCMPMQARVRADLPLPGAQDATIARAMDQRPDTAVEAGLRRATCTVDPLPDGLRVTARLTLPRVGPDEMVVMETPNPAVWVSEAMTQRSGATLIATLDIVPPPGAPFLLNRSDLRLTVLAAGRAVDIQGCDAGS